MFMIITSQGYGHYTQGLNNQDFGCETPQMVLILDGCSGAKYSDAGVRLFAQLLSRKEDCDKEEFFESNVKSTFKDIIEMSSKYYKTQDDLENNYILENLLFTIIACFQTKDNFIVKLFGDGYIITQNKYGSISYMRFSYGQCPPYWAYKYCSEHTDFFKNYNFKKFVFDKKIFEKVAIATDGIMPAALGQLENFDRVLKEGNEEIIKWTLNKNRQIFDDDVTIGMFGGK